MCNNENISAQPQDQLGEVVVLYSYTAIELPIQLLLSSYFLILKNVIFSMGYRK